MKEQREVVDRLFKTTDRPLYQLPRGRLGPLKLSCSLAEKLPTSQPQVTEADP